MEIESKDKRMSTINLNRNNKKDLSVKVAIRARGLQLKEFRNREINCLRCDKFQKIIEIGKNRRYKFDEIFDEGTTQEEVYNTCAKELIDGCFEGYNATILAYGQTASGKTYTMGSLHKIDTSPELLGIIPRVIDRLFQKVTQLKDQREFILTVSFIEIYNGVIQDLLDDRIFCSRNLQMSQKRNQIRLREEKGEVTILGINQEVTTSAQEMINCLERGSLKRRTA